MMSVVTRSGHDVIAGRYMAFFEPERVYKFPYPKKPIAHELATYVRQKIYVSISRLSLIYPRAHQTPEYLRSRRTNR